MSKCRNTLSIFSTPKGALWATFSLLLTLFALFSAHIAPALADPPFEMPPKAQVLKIRSAVVTTNKGEFLIELRPDVAPLHVANFKFLADKGFYNNIKFHIYKEDYIIQGGDPTGTGNGGPGYNIHPEFSALHHEKGTVVMSRRPDNVMNPERLSNGSQFHILLGDAPFMDKKYTIFGKVIDGMSVVEKLREGDTINSIRVYVTQSQRSGESK